ncbi:hypothetical protein Peur_048745 [Populus x canadensis]
MGFGQFCWRGGYKIKAVSHPMKYPIINRMNLVSELLNFYFQVLEIVIHREGSGRRKAVFHHLKYHFQAFVIPIVRRLEDGRPLLMPAWELKVFLPELCRITEVGVCSEEMFSLEFALAVTTSIPQPHL